MYYQELYDLPHNVKNILPKHVQHAYLRAFNKAINKHGLPSDFLEREKTKEQAHHIALQTIKNKYMTKL